MKTKNNLLKQLAIFIIFLYTGLEVSGQEFGHERWGTRSWSWAVGAFPTRNQAQIKLETLHDNVKKHWTLQVYNDRFKIRKGEIDLMYLNNDGLLLNRGWLRVKGKGGLHFQDYGGGLRMTEPNWIKTYGGKGFYHDGGILRTEGELQVGGAGDRFVVKADGKVGIGVSSPTEKLEVAGNIKATGNIETQGNIVIVSDLAGKGAKSGAEVLFRADRNGDVNMKNAIIDGAISAKTGEFGSIITTGDGRLGIGTNEPVSNLQIKNNVGTDGNPFDKFNDYQVLLHKSLSNDPQDSYGIGIETGTLAFNTFDKYNFYRKGALALSLDGNELYTPKPIRTDTSISANAINSQKYYLNNELLDLSEFVVEEGGFYTPVKTFWNITNNVLTPVGNAIPAVNVGDFSAENILIRNSLRLEGGDLELLDGLNVFTSNPDGSRNTKLYIVPDNQINSPSAPGLVINTPTLLNEYVQINNQLKVTGAIDASAYTINGQPFTGGLWTESTDNSGDISYAGGKVTIGSYEGATSPDDLNTLSILGNVEVGNGIYGLNHSLSLFASTNDSAPVMSLTTEGVNIDPDKTLLTGNISSLGNITSTGIIDATGFSINGDLISNYWEEITLSNNESALIKRRQLNPVSGEKDIINVMSDQIDFIASGGFKVFASLAGKILDDPLLETFEGFTREDGVPVADWLDSDDIVGQFDFRNLFVHGGLHVRSAMTSDNLTTGEIKTNDINAWNYYYRGNPIDFSGATVGGSKWSDNGGGIYTESPVTIGVNKAPIANTKLHVDGRVYISEEGGDEKGLSNTEHDNFKNFLLWVEEGIVTGNVGIANIDDFPDYVFKEDYDLPSLKEIENHIKEKGHLHTMLAGAVFEKEGYTVTDMNNRVVRTIEELTLHTIAQEKKITELERKLSQKEKDYSQLDRRLEKIEKLIQN